MQQTIKLDQIEALYNNNIMQHIENGGALTPDLFINTSVSLFNDFKIQGVSTDPDEDGDLLLFQYGVYDWRDHKGEHFSFDITRQIITMEDGDMYQLSLNLIFDPAHFRDCESYNSWSLHFVSIEDWTINTRQTKGYRLAKEVKPRLYEAKFFKV